VKILKLGASGVIYPEALFLFFKVIFGLINATQGVVKDYLSKIKPNLAWR
jgi:hypothetical protein